MKRYGDFKTPLIAQATAIHRDLFSALLTPARPKYDRVERHGSQVKVPFTAPPFPHRSGHRDRPAQYQSGGSGQTGGQLCGLPRLSVLMLDW